MNWSPSSWWTLGTRCAVTSVTVGFKGLGCAECHLYLLFGACNLCRQKSGREGKGRDGIVARVCG